MPQWRRMEKVMALGPFVNIAVEEGGTQKQRGEGNLAGESDPFEQQFRAQGKLDHAGQFAARAADAFGGGPLAF